MLSLTPLFTLGAMVDTITALERCIMYRHRPFCDPLGQLQSHKWHSLALLVAFLHAKVVAYTLGRFRRRRSHSWLLLGSLMALDQSRLVCVIIGAPGGIYWNPCQILRLAGALCPARVVSSLWNCQLHSRGLIRYLVAFSATFGTIDGSTPLLGPSLLEAICL